MNKVFEKSSIAGIRLKNRILPVVLIADFVCSASGIIRLGATLERFL